MKTVNSIVDGIEEYRSITGKDPKMITVTEEIESRIKLEMMDLVMLPASHRAADGHNKPFEIRGIPLNVIFGNSTAITYES